MNFTYIFAVIFFAVCCLYNASAFPAEEDPELSQLGKLNNIQLHVIHYFK